MSFWQKALGVNGLIAKHFSFQSRHVWFLLECCLCHIQSSSQLLSLYPSTHFKLSLSRSPPPILSKLSQLQHPYFGTIYQQTLELQTPQILLKGSSRPISFRTHSCSISFNTWCIHSIFTITALFSILIVTSGHPRFISYLCKCIILANAKRIPKL